MTRIVDYLDSQIIRLARMASFSPKGAAKFVKLRRTISHLGSYLRRRSIARRILENSEWANFIPREQGYRLLTPDSLPGSERVVQSCRELFAAKGGIKAFQQGKKPFFTNILEYADLEAHPEFLDFILSDAVIESVAGYLGTLPRLNSLGLFVSDANETTKSSQLYHFDGEDFRMVKCFYNLDDVAPENGPFTFLPRGATQRVCEALGVSWGHHRFEDEDIEKICARDEAISLTGKAGNGAFVDTASCLHFGSRARAGYRIVLMFCYSPHPNVKIDKGTFDKYGMPLHKFPTARYADDAIRRTVLGLDA